MEQHIQRYTTYIHEALHNIDVNTATYKEHLHKVFEWYGCICLSRQSGNIVQRWEDIPMDLREEKRMTRDMGIDALDLIGHRAIQMKLYHGNISWRALSTFVGCCRLSFPNHKMILYRNTESQLCSYILDAVKQKTIEDITISDADFRKECKQIQKLKLKTVIPENKMVNRPYQVEAKKTMKHAENTNAFICIPTGGGKTWIILDYHLENRDETWLILVPTCVLLEQWNDACNELGINAYLVDSKHHRDLKQLKEQTIVICVYDSYIHLYEERERFKRIIVDEAHHIIKPERYMETDGEHDEFSDDEEIEERAASYISRIRELYQTNRVIYLSATLDRPNDNSLFYEYKIRQAISDGYLCDYQFVFPIFEQEYITNQHLAEYLIHRQNETHCLIYASNCKEGMEFVDMLNTIQKGCAGYIDAKTTPAKRKKLFEDFESGKIRFLINIRVLVEGFNAPHVRSIFFLHISSNDIFIIQAIGRALRLHRDKIKATIYVPFTHEDDIDRIQAFLTQLSTYDERIHQSISEKKVGGYLNLERGEAQEEEKIDDSLFEFRYNLIVDRMGNSNQLEEMSLKKALEYKAFYEEFGRKPKQVLTGKTKEQKDNATEEQKHEHRLAQWLSNMKSSKKGNGRMNVYPSVEKILIELFGEKWYENKNLEELAIKQALEYKTFYQEKQRKPIQTLQGKTKEQKDKATKEQKYEYRLATWFGCMKLSKKGKGGRMLYASVEKILIELFGETWFEDEKLEEIAINTALKYKTFYEEKQRKPSTVLSNKTKTQKENASEEQKHEHRLAQWLANMKTSKKNRSVKGGMTLYPSVEKILIEILGETWYENKDLEENAIKNAIDYRTLYQEKKQKPVLVLSQKTKRDNATDEQKHEHRLAQWLDCMKKSKTKPNKDSMKLYPSVEKILIELLGETWYENENFEALALEHVLEYKKFYEEKQRKPLQVLCGKTKEQKDNATDEEKYEQKLAQWFGNMKNTKKRVSGKGMKLYPSVEKIIIELLGETWYENKNLEELAIKQALEYKLFYEERQRKASDVLQGKKEQKDNAREEQLDEHRLARWFGSMKLAKTGKGTCKLYPLVDKILIDLLGETWYENENLEDESLKKVLEYKAFYQEKQRKPSKCLNGKSKEKKDKATDEQKQEHILAEWFGGIKRSKKGKGNYNLYPSVEKILIETLGNEWFA